MLLCFTERKSISPAHRREEHSEGMDDRFPVAGLPPHLMVVPMELDSGSQSEGESSVRTVGFDSPLQPTLSWSPLHTSRPVKDPTNVSAVLNVVDGQAPTGPAEVQRELATEPLEGTGSCRSDGLDSHTQSSLNESLVVGISDLGLATRLDSIAPDVPRKVLHNMYVWAKGQMDRNMARKVFNNAYSSEVDVRTHVHLMDWMEANAAKLGYPRSISEVEAKRNQFRDEVRKDVKLMLSSVVENLANEELALLMNTCPPRLLLPTTANYAKTVDCEQILRKAGYLCTRQDEPRVKSLLKKSNRVKMILRNAKLKGKSVAAALRECSEGAKQSQQEDDNMAASLGRKQRTEDTVAFTEGTPAIAASGMPISGGGGQSAGCSASTTEDNAMTNEDSTTVVGRGSTTGPTMEGCELPTEDFTFMARVGPDNEDGESCEHGVRNMGQDNSCTYRSEWLPVHPCHDHVQGDARVSENQSSDVVPNALTQPDGKTVEVPGSAGPSSGQQGALKQPECMSKDSGLSTSGTRWVGETLSVEMGDIPFTKPEFTANGLSRVKRVPKEGIAPNLLNHFRIWARGEFQTLYSLKQFNSVHSMEINVRTAVKWLEWFNSRSGTCSFQTLEKQRMTLHRVVRNEFRGMLLIVKENVAIEEAKAVMGNKRVMQSILSGVYQRKLCWDDLVQRMGYVVPRAEEGDEKAQDLLKKVDQVHMLIKSRQKGSNTAKAVHSDASNRKPFTESSPLDPTSSVMKVMPRYGAQTGDHGIEEEVQSCIPAGESGRSRSSRSKSNTSTSSEVDSSSDSIQRRRRKGQERRSGSHKRSRSRSSNSPKSRCSQSRQTSWCRESSYDETACSDAGSSRVRASQFWRKRSKSCERSNTGRISPSSDLEKVRMRQKYADEEDMELLEMRRKLLQSILEKQQKGQELATQAECAALTAGKRASSDATQETFVMLHSSLVEANVEALTQAEKTTVEGSLQLTIGNVDRPSVECKASVKSGAFDYISEDEDAQNVATGLQGEQTSACDEMGMFPLPSTGTVGYSKNRCLSPRSADSYVLKMAAVCRHREVEEGEIVSSEDEAPLVIDCKEEGAWSGERDERKQMVKSSRPCPVASCVLAIGETARDGTAPFAGENVCDIARSNTIETSPVPELIVHQVDAHATSEQTLEESVGVAYSCGTELEQQGQDMPAAENATEVKEPSRISLEQHMEEADTHQANVGSSDDIFRCDDVPPAAESSCVRPSVPAVPSVEVSLDAFIAQSKISSQLIRKAFRSSIVGEEDSGFAMETSSQRPRGVGRQVSAPANLATAKVCCMNTVIHTCAICM